MKYTIKTFKAQFPTDEACLAPVGRWRGATVGSDVHVLVEETVKWDSLFSQGLITRDEFRNLMEANEKSIYAAFQVPWWEQPVG